MYFIIWKTVAVGTVGNDVIKQKTVSVGTEISRSIFVPTRDQREPCARIGVARRNRLQTVL